jgi:hypothetical protein
MGKAIALTLALLAPAATSQAATLAEWAFNLNGTVIPFGAVLPGNVNAAGFDFGTGLGQILISIAAAGPGAYHVLAFFDHDIDPILNSSFNEEGRVNGATVAGQSWQIGDPFGTIYPNMSSNTLNNTNSVPTAAPPPNICCDVSTAMGFNVNLQAGENATVTFVLGTTNPSSFSLAQFDPDSGETVYLSGSVSSGTPSEAVIPEPSTVFLALAGLVILAGATWIRGNRT